MTQLIIDNVDEHVYRQLKQLATFRHRSVEDEARAALGKAVTEIIPNDSERADIVRRIDAFRENFPKASDVDALKVLREMRDTQ